MKSLVIHFARFGPYHLARLRSAQAALSPLGWKAVALEIAATDSTYAWRQEKVRDGFEKECVFPGRNYDEIPAGQLTAGVHAAMDRLQPAAVAVAGYFSADARACLAWCRRNSARALLMSETRQADGRRVWCKEWIKSRIVRRFGAALCGGGAHRDYLIALGLPKDRIHFGYDVVDNESFASDAAKWRSADQVEIERGERKYFLASNRFIERKNLATLLDAFARYTREGGSVSDKWSLILLGDGERKASLLEQCRRLGLEIVENAPWEIAPSSLRSGKVFFPGFRQIEELPRFYARAGCFVHPAVEEPWGLVINEAMASGLPVLASTGTGAAEELVEDGVNGWRFNPSDEAALALLLRRVHETSAGDLAALGAASRRILEEKAPLAAFGEGLRAGLPVSRGMLDERAKVGSRS